MVCSCWRHNHVKNVYIGTLRNTKLPLLFAVPYKEYILYAGGRVVRYYRTKKEKKIPRVLVARDASFQKQPQDGRNGIRTNDAPSDFGLFYGENSAVRHQFSVIMPKDDHTLLALVNLKDMETLDVACRCLKALYIVESDHARNHNLGYTRGWQKRYQSGPPNWLFQNVQQCVWKNPCVCHHIFNFLTFRQLLQLRRLNAACLAVIDRILTVRLRCLVRYSQVSLTPHHLWCETPSVPRRYDEVRLLAVMALQESPTTRVDLPYTCVTTRQDMGRLRVNIAEAFIESWSMTSEDLRHDLTFLGTRTMTYCSDFLVARRCIITAMRLVMRSFGHHVRHMSKALEEKQEESTVWSLMKRVSLEHEEMSTELVLTWENTNASRCMCEVARCLKTLPSSFLQYCAALPLIQTKTKQRNSVYAMLKGSFRCLFHWLRCVLDLYLKSSTQRLTRLPGHASQPDIPIFDAPQQSPREAYDLRRPRSV